MSVVALCDADGPFFETRAEAFTGASGPAWDAARRVDAGVSGPGDRWHLHFHAFLLDAGGTIVLVDTGIGPHGSPASGWAPVPGRLIAALEAEAVAPADVDVVVLTHLHSDHVGWAVTDDRPTFVNARHVVQRDEIDGLGGSPLVDAVVVPLRRAGLLDAVTGERKVAGGVSVVPTPGHTPGHQSVAVGDRLVLTGDVLVHPVQLVDPSVAYHYEADPDVARSSRERLLAGAAAHDALLGVSHFSLPFVPARQTRPAGAAPPPEP